MGSNPDDSLLQDTTNFDSSGHQVPVLSMEPISMKKKKKGGAYNLRKSLAWDRAFLTEEGILDPVELSVITGTCINPAGQALSVITEVGANIKRGDSQNITTSPTSRSHQRSKASQKMSTSHCASGSVAKSSGCPRPSSTSSLKRPAFVNTSRSSAKELKFSKTAIPKPSMCSILRSAKSSLSVGSQLQHYQFVRSAANIQTCTSSSKIPTIKNTPQVKAGSAASPSTTSSKSLKENSTQAITALPLHPSTKICQPPVSKVSNTFSKKTPREVDTLGISQTNVDGSVVIAPVPQRTTVGKSMHNTQFQAKKPSGLRMPSPSLGFFGQPKVSVSNQPSLMSFKPNIPDSCKLHDRRKTKLLHESSSSTMPLSSTTQNSTLSDSDGVSSETSESVVEKKSNKFVHAEFSCDELSMHGADAIDKLNKVYAQKETGKQIILKCDSVRETSESVLKQNMNKLEHAEISYDDLPVHGVNTVDESDKVHAEHATRERIIPKGESEHKINDTVLLLKPEDGEALLEADDMEKSTQGFRNCRSNDSDLTCSPSLCWVGFTGDSEHKINDTGLLPQPEDGESLSQADDMDKSIQGFLDCRSNDSEHKVTDSWLLQEPEDGESFLEADDMEKSIQGFQDCRRNDSDSACFPSLCFVGLTGDSEHKINDGESLSQADDMEKSIQGFEDRRSNDTALLPQPEGGERLLEADDMEKGTQGFQDCRSNDNDSTCSPSMCWVALTGGSEHKIKDTEFLAQPEDGESLSQADDMKMSIQGFQDCRSNDSDSTCPALTEGEIISNSAVMNLSFASELTLPAEDIVPDNKSSTLNHHGLPMESCYQSLDQSDVTNCSPFEVPDCDKKRSPNEVPEHNTCRCVEVLTICGEMKCQTPESCNDELESSCFLCRGKYKDCSTDTGSRTEVDDKTYLGEGQSHASYDLIEYPEKHLETERIHNAVEESSDFNLGYCATGDLSPDTEPRQEKIIEVPSSTAPEESDKRCEGTSCTKHFSLQGQTARENLRRSQHNFDGLKNNILEDEDNADILYKVDISASEESAHNSGSISIEKIKNSEKDLNKNDLQIILPKDLVPFSEEWLAAIEAAGEDVLTLKTGAVQNSPPDKSLPEPSPWSPVKRKTNQLGPFDCTKYTNPVPSDSH